MDQRRLRIPALHLLRNGHRRFQDVQRVAVSDRGRQVPAGLYHGHQETEGSSVFRYRNGNGHLEGKHLGELHLEALRFAEALVECWHNNFEVPNPFSPSLLHALFAQLTSHEALGLVALRPANQKRLPTRVQTPPRGSHSGMMSLQWRAPTVQTITT